MSEQRYMHIPYLIRSGDTLSEIAQRFLGDGSRYPEIQAINLAKIPNAGMILAGDTIMIPVPFTQEAFEHTEIQKALKTPQRRTFPTCEEDAQARFRALLDLFEPTHDRDLDLASSYRAEGVLSLAYELGLLSRDDVATEEDKVNYRFDFA